MNSFLKYLMMLIAMGSLAVLGTGCSGEEEAPITEEEMLPGDDLDLLDEPELESLEEEPPLESLDEEELVSEDDVKPMAKKPEAAPSPEPEPIAKPRKAPKATPPVQPRSSGYSFVNSGDYVVQISIFKNSAGAERLKNKLKDKGFPAYVSPVSNPTPELEGTYYRVRVGNFATVSEAKNFGMDALGPLGYDYWVDLKSNNERAPAPKAVSKPVKKISKPKPKSAPKKIQVKKPAPKKVVPPAPKKAATPPPAKPKAATPTKKVEPAKAATPAKPAAATPAKTAPATKAEPAKATPAKKEEAKDGKKAADDWGTIESDDDWGSEEESSGDDWDVD